ncbi:MAG: alanine racemase [Magnetococcales bacterium]|nr:alanine racemase [Magnetococcales bacterium]MBF0150258.1 alanine racemase [Magnetococcales bacterium]MBF0172160.1 alanine racemase [Magnetococcales bacterium]MBF0347960.1 alanine racemase [Magnetococcales bacterium]
MNASDPLPPWEPPMIQPLHHGTINKFGHRRNDASHAEIDGIPIDDLVTLYGSPLFITSEQRLRHNVRTLRHALETHYPHVVHGWSYKTNITSAICRILHQEGSWAEVVSRSEYEKARLLGVPGNRILFNGPYKPRPILERAIAEEAHIHIDHLDELTQIEAIARQHDRVVPVTLRLNFNTGFTEPWSRFGFNLENGQAHEAAVRIRCSPHLTLTGLHSHLGTFILDPRAYGRQVTLMTDFMREVEQDGSTRIHYLDIGGGFPSRNALQGVYAPPEQAVPEIKEYAREVGTALNEGLSGRPGPQPLLIFESGRAVVDDAQSLVATVVGTKRLVDGRRGVILDAGINLMLTGLWYHHPVRLVRPKEGIPEETVLFGPLCMNIDVMRHLVSLPPLAVGDRLVFTPVGAYNNTQWLQFIELRPPIILVSPHGTHELIRQGETLASLCEPERMPPHLNRNPGQWPPLPQPTKA